MATHTIRAVQLIPASIEEVWELFSNANNLKKITPADMNFRVISSDHSPEIFKGQIIEYKVSPLFHIPLYWKTEIVDVKQHISFIDEQRKGPYSLWHHEHHFKTIEGGVEMIDEVTYRLPLGFLGSIAHLLVVKANFRKIFEFRYNKVAEIFGKWGEMNISFSQRRGAAT